MKCIYCEHKVTSVSNSRVVQGGAMVWRRRTCLSCGSIFTTREGTFFDNLFIIKRSGARVRFVYEKLFASIFVAVSFGKSRDNGSDAVTAKKITYAVLNEIRKTKVKELPSSSLTKSVYKVLKKEHPYAAETYKFYSEYRRKVLAQ